METSDTVRHYANGAIDISYDAHRCIHAAECIAYSAIGRSGTAPGAVPNVGE
jgi:uncharacterized Fe-S cluster protein YjdI